MVHQEDMSNVIVVDFTPDMKNIIHGFVLEIGQEEAIKFMMEDGLSESYCRVMVRHVLAKRGWGDKQRRF